MSQRDEWPSPYGGGPHPRRILGHVEEVSCSAMPVCTSLGANLTAPLLRSWSGNFLPPWRTAAAAAGRRSPATTRDACLRCSVGYRRTVVPFG
jgi:hypothetical protein